MTIQTPYECYLEVLKGGKGVPYAGGPRPEGSINHGFRSLKGKPQDASLIPEVFEDPALREFLERANAQDTAFFTVGCVSGRVQDEQGHRMSGYVEISINDRRLVADASNYFAMFWHFCQAIQGSDFSERVTLHWQIIGATFLDAQCDGMTCRIIINTHYNGSSEAAYASWSLTLRMLADTFVKEEQFPFDRIYQAPNEA